MNYPCIDVGLGSQLEICILSTKDICRAQVHPRRLYEGRHGKGGLGRAAEGKRLQQGAAAPLLPESIHSVLLIPGLLGFRVLAFRV